jgi:hypothetical protein
MRWPSSWAASNLPRSAVFVVFRHTNGVPSYPIRERVDFPALLRERAHADPLQLK